MYAVRAIQNFLRSANQIANQYPKEWWQWVRIKAVKPKDKLVWMQSHIKNDIVLRDILEPVVSSPYQCIQSPAFKPDLYYRAILHAKALLIGTSVENVTIRDIIPYNYLQKVLRANLKFKRLTIHDIIGCQHIIIPVEKLRDQFNLTIQQCLDIIHMVNLKWICIPSWVNIMRDTVVAENTLGVHFRSLLDYPFNQLMA